jgi:hypothetical protein
MFVNLGRFWFYASSSTRCLGLIFINLPILILAAAELWRVRRSRPSDVIWIVLAVEYVWFMYSAIIVHSRFYLPVMPLLLPFALARAMGMLRSARRKRDGVVPREVPSRTAREAVGV